MIISVKIDPGVLRIYQTEADERKTTVMELIESILAGWAVALKVKTEPDDANDSD